MSSFVKVILATALVHGSLKENVAYFKLRGEKT